MFKSVLIANRGEIAVRIIAACQELGIRALAVYSEADRHAAHVRAADAAYCIGPAPARESYLDIARIVSVAVAHGTEAIHPGYGFLSENADFAAACRDAGLIFIGPAPEVIARMGSKREAKLLMASAGVPVVPGYTGADQSDERFLAAAREIGYPVLVKASAGGGGKGMRAVEREADLLDALAAARREARSSFGGDTLLLERLIVEPRHVELQIFGDEHGNVIHLGERECSIQRRHQKVVEETPSTALTPELRARMGESAVTVGRQLGYTSAGTVEFVLDPDGTFYFLEVNTRLQVEHPVTELVTGLDLVRWQIEVAEGRPLPLAQDQIRFSGHSVEVRLYAEDPANGFLPATGPIVRWREPAGEGVRVDSGIATSDELTPYYDPLLAKIVAHGTSRDEALRRLDRALGDTVLFGVRNNLDFLRRVLLHPDHRAGNISTSFIERHADDLIQSAPNVRESDHPLRLAATLAAIARFTAADGRRSPRSATTPAPGLPTALQALESAPLAGWWRNNPNRPLIESFELLDGAAGGEAVRVAVRLTPCSAGQFGVMTSLDGEEEEVAAVAVAGDLAEGGSVEVGGRRRRAMVARRGDEWWVRVGETTHHLRWGDPLPVPAQSLAAPGGAAAAAGAARGADAVRPGALVAPMAGLVVSVLVEAGQAVGRGDPLLILEAMKMEHIIRAPRDAVVETVEVAAGQQVQPNATLLQLRQPATVERSG